MRNFWVFGLLFVTFTALTILTSTRVPNASLSSPGDTQTQTPFVHLFEWTWEDVAQECEQFLGPKGFSAVQISPPNEHAVLPNQGFPWWQRYQPVSYQLKSRSGDRQQFTSMVQRCHNAGVKVYADAVINHMAGVERGVGSAGSRFTKYNYPGLYNIADFHRCHHSIGNYQNHEEVTDCELVGLADLNTSSPKVQQHLAQYLKDLLSLGIDGFRIDAAKHINTSDLGGILKRLQREIHTEPYIYQEVIDPGYEAVKKTEYYPNGDVFEFEYGRLLGQKFLGTDGQNLSELNTLGESWGLMPSDKAVVFIDNHDKQRGHGGGGTYLTYKDGKLYDLANIFMLAYPYGYPQVMSSYAFNNSDQGPPADAQGHTLSPYNRDRTACNEEWVCEHRRGAIANMVGFRKAVGDTAIANWWSNGNNQIAFGRRDKGFVIINRESAPLLNTFQTQLPAGTYCNIIKTELTPDGQSCRDPKATLTIHPNGQMTAAVEGMDAVAIHINAKLQP